MKKTNDSLRAGSVMLNYCLHLAKTFLKRGSNTGLMYFFPVFALILYASSPPHPTLKFAVKGLPSTPEAILKTSEVCNEFTITNNTQTAELELPKFDPGLGKLVGVEVVTDCIVMGDVHESAVAGTEYQLQLSIDLSAQLPGQATTTGTLQNIFRKKIKDTAMQSNGFQEKFEASKQTKESITTNLSGFSGSGNLSIPLKVDGLINYKDAVSNISSNLKVKVCLKYIFE